MSGDMKFYNKELQTSVRKNFASIVRSFDPNDAQVLDKLFGHGIITSSLRKQISDIKEKENRSRNLLDELLEISQSNQLAISKFLEILYEEEAYRHICDVVYQTAEKEKVTSTTSRIPLSNRSHNFVSKGKSEQTIDIPKKLDAVKIGKCVSDWNLVQKSFNYIIDNLDPKPVLRKLFEKDIFTVDQLDALNRVSDTEECCEKLLLQLFKIKKQERVFVFKNVLKEVQPWLYNWIWGNPDTKDCDNRSLTCDEKHTMKANILCLGKFLEPDSLKTNGEDFLYLLLEKDCITMSQYNQIVSKSSRKEMFLELLKTLMRRSFIHYQQFINCLKFTYQHNLAKILESNGIVLEVHVDLKNTEVETYLADIITKTAKFEELELDPREKELIQDILRKLEKNGLFIIGALPGGSLIIYILCSSLDSLKKLEKMYETDELRIDLLTLINHLINLKISIDANVEIRIDQGEFERGLCFFENQLKLKLQEFHCFNGGQLNNMPFILSCLILKRASWMMFICYLIESLPPGSRMLYNKYLENGVDGFLNFVEQASSHIFLNLSTVCFFWCRLIKTEKDFKTMLLSQIMRAGIRKSFKVLVASLHIQELLPNLSFGQNLITEKEQIEGNLISYEDRNKQFLKVLRQQPFKYYLEFLYLLENGHQNHLANYVISFGVWWPNFKKKWPLDKKRKLRIAAYGEDLIKSMDIEKSIFHTVKKEAEDIQLVPAHEMRMISVGDEREWPNLVKLLLDEQYITSEQLDQLEMHREAKKQILLKLLDCGSLEMYEIVVDYFSRTQQNDVVHLLQQNPEVRNHNKLVINCLAKATEILDIMIRKKKIASLDHFADSNRLVQYELLSGFEKNEIVLNILECSKLDIYIFFLNILLTTEQFDILLPLFQSISHQKLIEDFETYLLDSIDADSNLLSRLLNLYVINSAEMHEIQSKSTFKEQNKELLKIISKKPPKSFNLFLAALVQTGSNILKKMQLLFSEFDILPTDDSNDNGVILDVEKEQQMQYTSPPNLLHSFFMHDQTTLETDQKNKFDKKSISMNSETDISNIPPSHQTEESEEMSHCVRNEKVLEYSLEKKESFDLQIKKTRSKSNMISVVFKNEETMPTDIQNILFLKKISIDKMLSVDIQHLSRHLFSIFGYLSLNSYGCKDLKVYSTNYTAMKKLSLVIDPAEVEQMNERKIKAKVEYLFEVLTKSIDPRGFILKNLYEERVLTLQQINEIEAIPDQVAQTDELLSFLLVSSHSKPFSIFLKALEPNYSSIIQLIHGTENIQMAKQDVKSKLKEQIHHQAEAPHTMDSLFFSDDANRPPQIMESLTSITSEISSQVANKATETLDSLIPQNADKSKYLQNRFSAKFPQQTMKQQWQNRQEQRNFPPQTVDSLLFYDGMDSGLCQPPTEPPLATKSLVMIGYDASSESLTVRNFDSLKISNFDPRIVSEAECKTDLPSSKDLHCGTDLLPSAEKSKNNESVVNNSFSVSQTVGKFVFNTLKISNFDPNVISEADIKSYFENFVRDASSFHMYTKNRKIYITFENPKVALDISRMDHPPLKVVPVEPFPPDAASCAVKLVGISSKHTQDYILLYIERVGREGSVESVHVDLKNNSAVVTFQNAGDIEPIMKARPYNMNGVEVNVSILQPQPPPRLHSDETEKLLLKVKYLPNGSTLRQFQMYVEEAACSIVERWTRLPCKNKKTEFNAVLEFSNTPDYARVRSLVSRKPFHGHMISVQRISKTRCISVHPVNYSEEFLHMYFENSKRSGGCYSCVSSVKLIPDKEIAIVTFSKPSVLSTILERRHKLHDQILEVKPYYLCLENCLPYNEDLDASGHQCDS